MKISGGAVNNRVDHGALKANQLIIMALSVISFIFDLPIIALGVALVMALGTLAGKPGFLPLYIWILRPLRLVKPDPIPDNPAPHRFAQGFGSIVMLAGVLAVFAGIQTAGWALVWLVILLAAVNTFAGFCVGCFMYYQLGRLGLPGISRRPDDGRAGFKPSGKGGLRV